MKHGDGPTAALLLAGALGIMAALLLAGCDGEAMLQQTANAETMPAAPAKRVQVVRVGVLVDDIAFDGKRGVYVITDTKTGKEYIGVSGVGISEVGQ